MKSPGSWSCPGQTSPSQSSSLPEPDQLLSLGFPACVLHPAGAAIGRPHGSGHRGVGFADLSLPALQLRPGFWDPAEFLLHPGSCLAHLPPAAPFPLPGPPAPRSQWAGSRTLPFSLPFSPLTQLFSGSPNPGASVIKGHSTCWHMQVIMLDIELLFAAFPGPSKSSSWPGQKEPIHQLDSAAFVKESCLIHFGSIGLRTWNPNGVWLKAKLEESCITKGGMGGRRGDLSCS